MAEDSLNEPGNIEEESEDLPDGFLSHFKNNGKYNPRESEDVTNKGCPDISTSDEPHDDILRLIQTSLPDVKWRLGVFNVLTECQSEQDVRKSLAFLQRNVSSAIKVSAKGQGTIVPIEENSAPTCLKCSDWMAVMDGLGLEITSPGSTSNIDFVDVTIGESSDVDSLKGFKSIMDSLLKMSWTNIQQLTRLNMEEGELIYHTLAALVAGHGINEVSRPALEEVESRFPFLLRSLGFRCDKEWSPLKWERPDIREEFDALCIVFHGLFRSLHEMQTII
ncbi:uncharacterized protein LOC128230460 [Mya arenaria]|uniref:uncharacterized protein LOC128230460 n=1 Tax=Mya arenaria TaxID=6604 RepID=UPI0022E3C5E2|nr:uncharacterized protein LOC128230460 [Mya arenaria]